MNLLPGTRLGPYRVVSPLGAGGMGEVYRAHDERLGRDVAVKVLPEFAESNHEALARFDREARAVAALSHPNILAIHDVGSDAGRAYAVTELLEGETLRERLRRERLRDEEIRDIALQVVEGLGAAHAKGIVHRDIKPENIFLTRDGRVKILDFGVARITGALPAGEEEPTAEQFRTGTGVVLGTIAYMAPEQLSGQPVDHRADLFSFGCLLYEMVTGERPFAGETAMATAAKILKEEPSMERVPARFRRAVEGCLEKDPAKRFDSAAAAGRAMDPAGSPARSRRPLFAVVALVLTMIAVAAVVGYRAADERGTAVATKPEIVSVAVLPFVNLGGNASDEYLSDGLTEELINVLGQVEGLRVPGRTSSFQFKGERVSLSEVASKLSVQHAIEGSVQRSGDRLRIRAQLVTVPAGVQVWSESYDETLSDLLGVQVRIAQSIVSRFGKSDAGDAAGRRAAAVDPEAHRLYLRGRHFAERWTKENVDQALASYRAAIERDGTYAAAYAGLADLYSFMDHRPALVDEDPKENYRQGEMFARKALALDPQAAEAHAALGHIYVHTGNFTEAERHLSEAVRINPSSPTAHLWYSFLLTLQGRLEEAAVERQKAVDFDPLSLQVNVLAASGAWRAGAFDQSIAIGEAAIAVLPDPTDMYGALARSYAFVGRFDDAYRALARAEANPRRLRLVAAQKAIVHALAGRRDEARAILSDLQSDPEKFPGALALASGWAVLGETDRALHWMQEAIDESPEYVRVNLYLPPHPVFRELRAHPRYIEARRKLGLPDHRQ
jgi:eukaryotic-like serine/threonine-protein kinase